MPFAQGAAFRASAGFVTDGANDDGVYSGHALYPITTPQGNTYGWDSLTSVNFRDRNAALDPRIAGVDFITNTATRQFRFDLPSAGTYNIRCALGDASSAGSSNVELFDDTTSLGTITLSASTTSGSFYDALGTVQRTAANWPSQNLAWQRTFASTICNFKFKPASLSNLVAYLYVEAVVATAVFNPLSGRGGAAAQPIWMN